MRAPSLHRVALWLALTWLPLPLVAAEVRVAVAANFAAAMRELTPLFEATTGHTLVTSLGATGLLFAQITHGAPYDLFLAADEMAPRKLVDSGHAVATSYFIYASGRLVLWSRDPNAIDEDGSILSTGKISRLAVANPKTAPYGAAAYETLEQMGLFDQLRPALVTGENISQTLQFVHSRNIPLGFVALAQVKSLSVAERGSMWLVPHTYHRPIRQAAVLLQSARQRAAAEVFLKFLRSPEALRTMRRLGYDVDAQNAQDSTRVF